MTPIDAFTAQAAYCAKNDAPITAAIVTAIADSVDETTSTGARILGWKGNPVADALSLRIAAGVHALWRRADAPELTSAFDGTSTRAANADAMRHLLLHNDAALLPWLDSPPQTNEPGRSAQLMAGLLEVVARHGPRMDILEIGSSAGLNLLIDRFRIELSGVVTGPAGSPVHLVPQWRGPPPPAEPPVIVSTRGVDIAPIDATDPAQAERLLAYVWADHTLRFERVARAIDMIHAAPPSIDTGDAADWVEARLREPQAKGVTRVLMHSIVWQYLGQASKARVTAAMEQAGARSTADRPLAWVRVEADRTVHQHDISLRSWPGHDAPVLIGHSHAHGFWVERLAEPALGHDLP